jgi:hypothetical protein
LGFAGDGTHKKTPSNGGVFGIGLAVDLSRAISGPRMRTFFRRQGGARICDHVPMMMALQRDVNPYTFDDTFVFSRTNDPGTAYPEAQIIRA